MKRILSILCGLFILMSSVFSSNVFAKEPIPIAMCLDNNYTLPTIVSMMSMLENVKEDTQYKYYLLVPGNFKDENKQKILSLKEKYKSKAFDIDFVNMGDEFEGAKNGYWSHVAYYRLMLPGLLGAYDKCIYLDADTIVNKDLSEFFNIKVEDNYIGGVKDFDHGSGHNKILKAFGIDNSQYINSGVLIMNLKKLRDEKVEDKFKWIFGNKRQQLHFPDQDIINVCCFGKIKLLPKKYNCMGEVKDPLIIHYAGGAKPWKNFSVLFAEKWWNYAIKSGFYDKLPKSFEIKKKISEFKANPQKTIDDSIYTISSKLDPNKCLDIKGGSKNDSANLQLLQKNGTNAQKFKVLYQPDGYYTIQSVCSGKFIDVAAAGNQNGANIQQYQGNGTDAQKWFIVPDGEGHFYLISKCNNLCMDVCGAKAKDGANIHCWDAHGGGNQRFKFEKCEDKSAEVIKEATKSSSNKSNDVKKSA